MPAPNIPPTIMNIAPSDIQSWESSKSMPPSLAKEYPIPTPITMPNTIYILYLKTADNDYHFWGVFKKFLLVIKMDLVCLSEQVLSQILTLAPVDQLINLSRKNRVIHDIVSRGNFWKEKWETKYPNYKGNLYHGSEEETLAQLEKSREIPVKITRRASPIHFKHITATMTIKELFDIPEKLPLTIIVFTDGTSVYALKGHTTVYFHTGTSGWRSKVELNKPLYAVQLLGEENLFFSLGELILSLG